MTFDSDAYEELTRGALDRLGSLRGLTTLRLERNLVLPGKATHHQIDVLWQFLEPDSDVVHTVLFECRHYKDRIKKGRLLEFKGVIEDIAAHQGPDSLEHLSGTMVTLSGYQQGAQRVADTYGLTIAELRTPTRTDLAGRVTGFRVVVRARVPRLDRIEIEPAGPGSGSDIELTGPGEDFEIIFPDGRRRNLVEHLLEGELTPLGESPRATRRVVLRFDPPAVLAIGGEDVLRVRAVGADLTESDLETEVAIDYRQRLAHVLLDALNGERVWFADDGRTWVTDRPDHLSP